ncbi:ABC transporter permease [Flocculibacter collagenilyticus]|uniref:ABC transporter permease n=1 Tax=Flocculibacter collagenilyticus TaxID=2744479 RepID=UPI0018F5BB7A|nr:ABC transporter permease [Flocculibacter collagenilyticus]
MFEVFKKELLEITRDRKTLFFVIALPMIIFPILFGLMSFLLGKAQLDAEQKVNTYAIISEANSQEFVEKIFYHKSFKKAELVLATEAEAIEAVKSEKVDVVIILQDNLSESFEAGKQAKWKVIYNDSSSVNFLYKNIQEITDELSEGLKNAKLESLGITGEAKLALLKPLELEKIDTADLRENLGEKLGAFIPYLLIPLCLMGATYPAVDLGAGEKERGTLETLLITPIPRTSLVLGKFLTVLTTAILCALITIFSMGFWGYVLGAGSNEIVTEIVGSIGVLELLLMFILLIPVSAIFASIAIALSIYAKTFKEGQNYMAPLSFLVFVPLVAAMMPNMELTFLTASIPITNIALAMKELLKGTLDYTLFGMILASTVAVAGALLAFCVHWFQKESVLFR